MEELKTQYLTLCNEVDYPISDEHMYKNIEILNCIKGGKLDLFHQ